MDAKLASLIGDDLTTATTAEYVAQMAERARSMPQLQQFTATFLDAIDPDSRILKDHPTIAAVLVDIHLRNQLHMQPAFDRETFRAMRGLLAQSAAGHMVVASLLAQSDSIDLTHLQYMAGPLMVPEQHHWLKDDDAYRWLKKAAY